MPTSVYRVDITRPTTAERKAALLRKYATYRRLRDNGLTPYRTHRYVRRGFPGPFVLALRKELRQAVAHTVEYIRAYLSPSPNAH